MSLSASELEARLEQTLDAVLSSRRTASAPARELAVFDEPTQRFALRWMDVVAASNAELAYHFVSLAPKALCRMQPADVEAWVVRALDVYDRQGLFPATTALSDLDAFHAEQRERARAVSLDDERGFLERYLRGLSGRGLKVAVGDDAHTDTETLFLPKRLARFAERGENRLLYKAMATWLWAMNRFGTFRRPHRDAPDLGQRLAEMGDRQRVMPLFYALETHRLNACIGRELPGLRREVDRVFPLASPARWADAARDLSRAQASVEDTLRHLARFLDEDVSTDGIAPYQGYADFAAAAEHTDRRLDEDRAALQSLIQELIDRMNRDDIEDEGDPDADIELNIEGEGEATRMEMTVDGEPVPIPDALRDRVDAILQDLESVPEDWLGGEGDDGEIAPAEDELPEPPDNDDPVFHYDEWDYQRGHYRKNWCTLYERRVEPGEAGFFDKTLQRHHGLVLDLRRAFELLRDEQHTLRRQPEGEDIDLDAVVDAATDQRLGRELSNRLFLKTHRHERDIAVMFMVDLSGSTKGWIVDAEREALVLLCEALEVLGDRYGIYGFSGMTRKRCELFHIKRLDEPLNEAVKTRIAGIMPRDYTRMGVTIRHLTRLMDEIDARTRLLITLSDGKPDDYDGYRGDYGIEDTRQALVEARNRGIHPFCITIDRQAGQYLPHMYGEVNYTVVDDVRKLPAEVSRVYCRLTR